MTDKWILNDRGEPEPCDDLMVWGAWLQKAKRHVAQDMVGKARVSTVFLGLEHPRLEDDAVCLWETMVFGGPLDDLQRRWTSRAEALAGHQAIVAALTCGDFRGLRPSDKGILGMFLDLMEQAREQAKSEEPEPRNLRVPSKEE